MRSFRDLLALGKVDPASNDAEMLCAADFPAERVEWLWPGRIPIGKVTLLVGDPGQGKSLVALDIAARVSRGGAWPEEAVRGAARPDEQSLESRAGTSGSPLSTLDSRLAGSVLILSAQDDLRDTIRPRLDAAGADPSRIFLLPSIVDLRNDLEKLRRAIDRAPDCRLIIIDPVNAYVGPGDSHFHTIVRRVFEPLAKLAAEKGIAILGVSHLRKNEGAAIQRAAGSMGFVAAARAVWTVCPDPIQTGRHLLLPLKNNFVADTAGLAYTIGKAESRPLRGARRRAEGQRNSSGSPLSALGSPLSDAPAIIWQHDTVTTSAAEALAPPSKSRGPEALELKAAAEWLRRELADGPREAEAIILDGHFAGFGERTLRRALYTLGGQTIKGSWFGGWRWSLPSPDGGHPSPADPGENLSPSGETCPLRENPDVFEKETCPLRENPDVFEQERRSLLENLEDSCMEPVSMPLDTWADLCLKTALATRTEPQTLASGEISLASPQSSSDASRPMPTTLWCPISVRGSRF